MSGELGPAARALLDAAREGLSPDAVAVRRVRARIAAAGGAAGATASGTTLGVKLGAVVLTVAVAAGAGWLVRRSGAAVVATPRVELASSPEAAVRTAMPEAPAPALVDDELITIEPPRGVAVPPPAAPVTTVPRVEPRPIQLAHPGLQRPRDEAAPASGRDGAGGGDPDGSAGGAGGLPRGIARRSRSAGSGDPDGSAGGAGGLPRGIDLAREVELVDLAMAALRRGDPRTALQAVQRHAVETAGRGQLAEDAAAIEIEALCHLHDPTTNARLEAFDARFPRSAQRSRLANTCP